MSPDEHKMPEGAEGGLPAKLAPKEQAKKLPKRALPEKGSEIQQLVNTLSQALKQSMAVSTERESKRNARAPRVYSAGQNFKTWLSQFLQYANLVLIKPSDRRAYLLTLLEQPAYKAVELPKLSESLTFEEFTAKLVERFDSGKTREDYKLQLRARCQRPNEDFEGFVDNVMEFGENAYPEAVYSFKVELARDQFIQGVTLSNNLREKVYMSQPESLVEAVRVVRRLESARKACQAVPSAEKKKSVNAVSGSAESEKASSEICELKELVIGMNDKIRELERKAETTSTSRRRNEVVCFACREPGHFARNSPLKEGGKQS